MTFWITATQQRQLRHLADTADFLDNTVKSYIEQQGEAYLNDDLLRVAYIGQRTAVHGAKVGDTPPPVAIQSGGALAFVSLATAGLFLVLVGLGVVLAYRRRRRRQESEAEPPGIDLDVETGAFPCVAPHCEGSRTRTNDEGTRESPPPHVQNARELVPPSSLAAMGGASALACHPSYTPPPSAPAEDESVRSSITEDHSGDRLDSFAPTIMDASSEKGSDDASAESSAFDALDEDEDEWPAPAMPTSEDAVGNRQDMPGVFDDKTFPESYEGEDELPQGRSMV